MSLISQPLSKDGNGQFKVTGFPIVEPITVDEVKVFGRIDGDYEDAFIASLIAGVRQVAEPFLGRALISQTITFSMDFWPGYVVELPRAPLMSITKVVTVDEDDVETEFNSSNYYADVINEPGRLIIKNGSSVPLNSNRYYGGYRIVFIAGYGGQSDIPEALKTGLKLWVMDGYENRVISNDPPPQARGYINDYLMVRI